MSKALDACCPFFGRGVTPNSTRRLQEKAVFDENGVLIDPTRRNLPKPIAKSFCYMKTKLPMQEPDDTQWRVAMGALSTWTNTLLASFVLSIFLARYFNTTLAYVVAYMKYT